MTNWRVLTIPFLVAALGSPMLCAGDLASYRGMQFGMTFSAAVKQTAANPNETRTVHQRPSLIQEIDWHPRWSVMADPAKPDSVRDGLLCFFNEQLFRIVITYDRDSVEGMTAEDMIEAISATYGAATRPKAQIAYHSNYGEVAQLIARWEDAEYSYNLIRTGDQSSFALVLYSKPLDALAQAAIAEAVRLEAQDAPQREINQQRKRDDEERLALEKARALNKPNFRP